MSRFPALRPGDAIPVLLALGAAFLAVRKTGAGEGGSVFLSLVTPAGAELLDMDRDTVLWIPVTDGSVEVQIRGRRARIAQSPCPSGYCVRTGWIESPGQTAVCMPEGVSLEIRGHGVQPDAVSY
jgi:hypothetical protein